MLTMAKAKNTASVEAETVRLFRLQDKFLTDPMPIAEAEEIMAGYPEEYEVYNPDVPAEPVQTEEQQEPAAPNGSEQSEASTTDEQQS